VGPVSVGQFFTYFIHVDPGTELGAFVEPSGDYDLTVDAGSTSAEYDLASSEISNATSARGSVSIAYDSATGSYLLTNGGVTGTFAPAEEVDDEFIGIRRYVVTDGDDRQILNLAFGSRGSGMPYKYVALGMWQRDSFSGDSQDTDVDFFTFGQRSLAADVPISGRLTFSTDVFGLINLATDVPHASAAPRAIQHYAETTFDLATGTFRLSADGGSYHNLFDDRIGSGGTMAFYASGTLTSGAPEFSGTFYYTGEGESRMAGLLEGSFFGSDASEIGGTFAASDSSGNTIAGGFAGINQGDAGSIYNLDDIAALDDGNYINLFVPAAYVDQSRRTGAPSFTHYATYEYTQLNRSDGSWRVAGYPQAEGQFENSHRVDSASDPYEEYERFVSDADGDQHLVLKIYKPDAEPTVELTYLTFAEYRRELALDNVFNVRREYFMIGVPTPQGVLQARTGSATYSGFLVGAAGETEGTKMYDLSGSAQFGVNFNTQAVTGSLSVLGIPEGGGSTLSFGTLNLASSQIMESGNVTTALLLGPTEVGTTYLRFFGPTGEEFGGTFAATTQGYELGGAIVSTRD
jgi:hypothetical protein